MNYPKYPLANTPENTKFSFISTGPKGNIELTILFTLDDNGFYQIALGPLTENNEIDDSVVVDNGDRNKILATVADATFSFFSTYPNAIVVFSGSTTARTRLYQRAISLNLIELQQVFVIYGILYDAKSAIEIFAFNKNYDGFLVMKKT